MSRSLCRRPVRYTNAPSFTKRCAVASPRPLLPPVITATLPCNLRIILFLPDSGVPVPMDTSGLRASDHRLPDRCAACNIVRSCHPGSSPVGIGLIPDRNGKGGTAASVRAGHPDYFAAGGRSLWSIRDCSALRNESSVSIVFVNPAWRSLTVLTKARGPSGAP